MDNGGSNVIIKKQYGAIDILRLVFAFSVVFMHRASSMKNETVFLFIRNNICELAVPFFIVASAFFLFRKVLNYKDETQKDDAFKKYIKRLVKLYIIWSIIYLIPTFYRGIFRNNQTLLTIMLKWIESIFVNGTSFWHLWYVQALIISLICFYYAHKKINTKMLIYISAVLYIFYSLNTNYTAFEGVKVLYDIFQRIQEFIPDSISSPLLRLPIFIMVGYLIADNKLRFSRLKSVVIFVVLYAAFTGIGIYRFYNDESGALLQCLASPVVMMALFYLAIQIETKTREIYKKFRTLSALIYFFHWFFLEEFLDAVLGILGFDPSIAYQAWFKFGITVIYSITFALIVMKLSQKDKFRFLRYLY